MHLKKVEEYGTIYRRVIDIPIGFILSVGYLLILLATSQMGVCRDETYYFYAGNRYFQWVENLWGELRRGDKLTSLTPREIRNYWSYNREHPPPGKAIDRSLTPIFYPNMEPFYRKIKIKI